MAHNILASIQRVYGLCLVWENTPMDSYIMENGDLMLKMDGEFMKIKQQDINFQVIGNKIKRMDLGNNKL